jgi:hypothetical protein
MNLTLLGLGVALVVGLPASANAQKPAKPVVEDTAALKKGNPTAAPKASPAATAPAESPAKGQVEPAAARLEESEPPEDETGGVQNEKEPLEPAAARLEESEPPEDETGGVQN